MGAVELLKKSAIAGRAGRISGSLVAGLLRDDEGVTVSPWMDECDVYSRIVNGWNVPDNSAMRRGRIFEPWVRSVASRRLGFDIREPWRETVFSSCGRFSGSFDGIAHDQTGKRIGVVELKTASKRSRAWYGLHETPKHYALQLEHYKWMAGLDQGWLVCLEADDEAFTDIMLEVESVYRMAYEEDPDPTVEFWDRKPNGVDPIYEDDYVVDIAVDVIERRLRSRTINLHVREHHDSVEIYEREVVPVLSEWFDRHIATKTPPALTGSEGSAAIVRAKYPKSEGSVEVTVGDEDADIDIARLICDRSRLAEEMKEKEREAKRLDVLILDKLGASKSWTLSRPPEGKEKKPKRLAKASIVTTKRKGDIDSDRLVEENPDIAKDFSRFDVKAFADAHPETADRYRGDPKVSRRISVTVYKGADVALGRFVSGGEG